MVQEGRPPHTAVREWLIFTVAVLVLGAVLAYLSHHEWRRVGEREEQRLFTQAELTHDMIALQVDVIGTTLSNIRADLPPGWETRQEAQALLTDRFRTLVSAMANLRTISILDSSGKAVVSSHEAITGQDLHEREYFQLVKKSPNPDILYVGPPFLTSLGVWTMTLSRAIIGENGEFAGVITASLDPKIFRIVLSSVRYASDVWASLAHGDGLLFLLEPDRSDISGRNLAVPGSFFTRHMESGQESSVGEGIVHATKEHRLVALHTIQPFLLRMDKPLVVAMARDVTAIYATWKRDQIVHAMVYALLVISGYLVLLFRRRHMRKAQRAAEIAREQVRMLREKLESFFEISPDMLCIMDIEGRFFKLNPSWQKMSGYPLETLTNAVLYEYLHPEDVDATRAAMSGLSRKDAVSSFCNRFLRPDGSYRYIEWHAASRGEYVFAAARDVTERRETELQLHVMAYHDRLTGLPNRALFFDRFSQAISGAKRGKKRVGLLFVDLDGFKMVNDQFGHDAGDAVLKAVARRFSETVRATDTVARTGGDEFLIVLPDLGDPEEAAVVARKLLAAACGRIAVSDDLECSVGASIGISIYPDHGEDTDALLVAADAAMYQSKNGGKNRYVFFDMSPHTESEIPLPDILDEKHLVGVVVIDEQHRKQAGLVAKLREAVNKKENEERIDHLFVELYDFTQFHFATEHSLMTKHEYPGILSHDRAHRYLLKELSRFRSEMSQGGDSFLFTTLEHWLLQHILSEDKPLGAYLAQKRDSGESREP